MHQFLVFSLQVLQFSGEDIYLRAIDIVICVLLCYSLTLKLHALSELNDFFPQGFVIGSKGV